MKKKILALSLIAFFLTAGCGVGKYADARSVLTKMVNAMEEYTTSMESADTTTAVASANNTFSDKMEKIIPKWDAIMEKYPEIVSETPPDELSDLVDRFKKVSEAFFSNALSKALQYANDYVDDAETQEAFKRLNAVMGSM